MNQIKVRLIGQSSSSKRGVGIYHDSLKNSLKNLSEICLTEVNSDIIHYTFFDLFYPTLPFVKDKPTVVTIHDLTPLVLSNRYPKGIKGSLSLIHQRLSLINVSAIITDSNCSKADLISIFRLPAKKIFTIPLAVDPLYKKSVSEKTLKIVAKKYQLPNKFIMTVAGGPNPNKNLPRLAEATKQLGIPLVIIGSGVAKTLPIGKVHSELKDLKDLESYTHLIRPGFVSTSELNAIYRLATLYCHPALYEGFGLPLLEAMTTGTLIVSSNSSSLPEIYSDKTITFSPTSVPFMLKALNKALSLSNQQKQEYIHDSLHRSHDFSWIKTASMTKEVYRHTLG